MNGDSIVKHGKSEGIFTLGRLFAPSGSATCCTTGHGPVVSTVTPKQKCTQIEGQLISAGGKCADDANRSTTNGGADHLGRPFIGGTSVLSISRQMFSVRKQ